ncbi:hypothetical protein EHQ12_11810 [Leptospira gomenensis]|uniref:Uncharacterized protein n=2 Tax=Leptospira gomenensis TaxID=2484974 RepID=A0A5F1YZ09_9LEPT|nr:hypothetical protein [Leptospira gomenensis]TGK32785.1 hypothetical protein EHQ17_11655 [Leptospira gomenensis]TGK37205.1 hypothetical protein EHQ12_11810 [Leptospira gomenensis]TGK48875.1 hypothetical protein EHQ07_05625 [Leptospira gomenensis]TGK64641.1 hypothetical protein EHQ13_06800 [Leptospira gomenensis]
MIAKQRFDDSNRSSSLAIFCSSFCLLFFCSIGCKQNPKDEIQKIIVNPRVPAEEKVRQASFLLLGDRLKEIEVIPDIGVDGTPSGKLKVSLSVGGNSALTFLGQKEYKERMKLEVALMTFRLWQTLQKLPIESFRISIVKPYYVKNSPTESIEEFEVFRARVERVSLDSIRGFRNVDSFAADSYDSPDPEVLDVMVQIVHSWNVELDELNRVEVN